MGKNTPERRSYIMDHLVVERDERERAGRETCSARRRRVSAGPGGWRADGHLRRLIDDNFIQYASYVIRDRAIPDLADGSSRSSAASCTR